MELGLDLGLGLGLGSGDHLSSSYHGVVRAGGPKIMLNR